MYIALTFDDGPNTDITMQILGVLERYGIVATFFVVGKNINEDTADILHKLCENSHQICSHSYAHTYMDKMTSAKIKEDENRVEDLIYKAVGEYPKFFRPPYIAVSDAMYESIDLPFICGVGCDDWDEKVSADEIISRMLDNVQDGEIILLHENVRTLSALDTIIPKLKERGYEFVTVSELFKIKHTIPEKYQLYSVLQTSEENYGQK